jgi:hypothetical protein
MADPREHRDRRWNEDAARTAATHDERKPSGPVTPLGQQAQHMVEQGIHDVGAFVRLLSGQDSASRDDVFGMLQGTRGNGFVQEVLKAQSQSAVTPVQSVQRMRPEELLALRQFIEQYANACRVQHMAAQCFDEVAGIKTLAEAIREAKALLDARQPQKRGDVNVRSDQLYSDETVMHNAFVPYAAVQTNNSATATPLTIDTGSHGGDTMYLTQKTRGLMNVKDAPLDVTASSVDTLDTGGNQQLNEQEQYPSTASKSSPSVHRHYTALSNVHDALPMTHFSQQNKSVAYRPNRAFTNPESAMGVANYNGSRDAVKTGPIEIGDRAQLNRGDLEKQGYKKLRVTIESGRPYFMAVVGGVVGLETGKQYKVLVDTGGLNSIYDEELYSRTHDKEDCTIPLLTATESDFTLHDMKFKPKVTRASIFDSSLGVTSDSTHNPQRPKSDQAICIGAAVFGVMERVVLDFGEGESCIWTKQGTPRPNHVQKIAQLASMQSNEEKPAKGHGEDEKKEQKSAQSSGWNFGDSDSEDEKKQPRGKEPKSVPQQSSGWNLSDSEDEKQQPKETKEPKSAPQQSSGWDFGGSEDENEQPPSGSSNDTKKS